MFDVVRFGFELGFGATLGIATATGLVFLALVILKTVVAVIGGLAEHKCQGGTQ